MVNLAEQTNALQPVIEQAGASLERASAQEIVAIIAVFVLAVLFAVQVRRWLERMQRTTWLARFTYSIAPLLAPGFALLFAGFAAAIFKGLAIGPVLLPFVTKVIVAWLAMRTVILVSPRESAGWFIALIIIPVTALHLLGLWDPLAGLMEDVKFHIGEMEFSLYLVLKTLATLVALFWVAGFITRVTDRRLRRMRRMHASSRALIMKIFQILLYFIVILVGMRLLGLDITALSVFGGALGVGLGFGLQKVASNFVSGLILLFEKSVEVDDWVEMTDGTGGFVRQIHARHSVIELFDGREVLIPNEDFITQRIINYTLSNRRGRIEIPVNIGYDTDAELAMRLMVEAACSHPECLKDPEPVCFALRFGEHALQLELHFWIPDVTTGRLPPRSAVTLAVHKAFRKHGIKIAVPQRDLHLYHDDSSPPAEPPRKEKK